MSNPVMQSVSRLSIIVFILVFNAGHRRFTCGWCQNLDLREISESESDALRIHMELTQSEKSLISHLPTTPWGIHHRYVTALYSGIDVLKTGNAHLRDCLILKNPNKHKVAKPKLARIPAKIYTKR